MKILPNLIAGLMAALALIFYGLLKKEQRSRRKDRVDSFNKDDQQTRQHSALEKNKEQLGDLFEALQHFASLARTDEPFAAWGEAMVQAIVSIVPFKQALLVHWDSSRRRLQTIASAGLSPGFLKTVSIEPGVGVIGLAAQATQPSFLKQAPADSGFESPLWVCPLQHESRTLAVLILGQAEDLSPALRETLNVFIAQSALSLINLHLGQRVEKSYEHLIQALARGVKARDAYTHNHSDRTRALVQATAEENKLPSALTRHIEFGALLHDLGKIGIDDAILRKPGKLTPEEYDLMKEHPLIGFRILEPLGALSPVAAIIRYHHEWYNGQGYPEGIAGEEIPLGARLVSVIDAWDAMTSNRPYRRAMSKAAAVAELRRQAGTQFDPKMVDAFLRVVDRLEKQGIPTTEAVLAHVE